MNLVRPLPHFPPHTPNAPLRPHNTLPGAAIGYKAGCSFKPTSPNSTPEITASNQTNPEQWR